MNRAPTAEVLDALAAELRDLAAEADGGQRLEHAAALAASLRSQLAAIGQELEPIEGLGVASEVLEARGHASRPPASAATALVRLAADGDHEAAVALEAFMSDELERRGITSAEDAAALATADPDAGFTPEDVTGYLRSRPGGAADSASEVRVLEGGYSKHTVLVGATLSGRDQEIVLRQVLRGRKAGSLVPEFAVLEGAFAGGLPVPEPLWIEPEENALGGPFFVTRRAPGENIGDVWGAAGADQAVALDLAAIYARIHGADADGLTTPASGRASDAEISDMLDWARHIAEVRKADDDPIVAGLLAWLRSHPPLEPEQPALLHGDAAFSNVLVADGRVSAVLDWEYAHIGNPAEELAYLRPSVEPVLPWDEFVGAYVKAGGTAPRDSDLQFFEVWSHVWRYLGCLGLADQFGKTGRYASAVAAWVHGPRFLQQAVQAAFGPATRQTTTPTGGIHADA